MIEARRLSFRYGRRSVLESVDLALQRGVTALIGENGAGKSTLMRVFATLHEPASGSLVWEGDDVWADHAALMSYRSQLGYVPQHTHVPGYLSARDVIDYACWLKGMDRHATQRQLDYVADELDLSGFLNTPVRQLSGGMRQRLTLAAAMATRPSVLLLDEPTVSLDPLQREQFLSVVRKLSRSCSVLMSSHLLEDVGQAADRIAVLGPAVNGNGNTLVRQVTVNDAMRTNISLIRDELKRPYAQGKSGAQCVEGTVRADGKSGAHEGV